jgi:hypothetical protein
MAKTKSINAFLDRNGQALTDEQVQKLLTDMEYKHVSRLVSMLMQGQKIGNNKELVAALAVYGVKVKEGKEEDKQEEFKQIAVQHRNDIEVHKFNVPLGLADWINEAKQTIDMLCGDIGTLQNRIAGLERISAKEAEELIEIKVTMNEGEEPRIYNVTKDVAELIDTMNKVIKMGMDKVQELENEQRS